MAALYMGQPVARRDPGDLGRIDTGFGETAPPLIYEGGRRRGD
jgi:hypothetical protein